jgi:hypothetical protein
MNNPDPSTDPTVRRTRNRNRVMLLAIVAIFIAPILIAGLINRFGKVPAPTRQHGQLLNPPIDLRGVAPKLADGGYYSWNPATRIRRLLVVAPPVCDRGCEKLGHQVEVVWELQGKDSDQVDVLWLCANAVCQPPRTMGRIANLHVLDVNSPLKAKLPSATTGAVYVIDPYGFVVLRYAPDFDPAGLRADLAKLMKLN